MKWKKKRTSEHTNGATRRGRLGGTERSRTNLLRSIGAE
jgi:hypothetical protein